MIPQQHAYVRGRYGCDANSGALPCCLALPPRTPGGRSHSGLAERTPTSPERTKRRDQFASSARSRNEAPHGEAPTADALVCVDDNQPRRRSESQSRPARRRAPARRHRRNRPPWARLDAGQYPARRAFRDRCRWREDAHATTEAGLDRGRDQRSGRLIHAWSSSVEPVAATATMRKRAESSTTRKENETCQ